MRDEAPLTLETSTAPRWMSPALGFALILGLLALPLLLFAGTTRSMVAIWIRAETFNHCFLVFPLFLWLVWGERHRLASLPARPYWPGLMLVAAMGALWLAGELASAIGPAQFGVVGMIPALILTVMGWAWTRVLLLPLAFLFFAVPFGEVLVPTLIDWTADFTVVALQMTGVPVYREGNHFIIPSGAWSVVEACSGIRYLIASLMVGCVYAWLMYRSTARRLLFLLASILTPLVANWLRAYLIVMLGHLSDNRIATGVDHIIYGWIFFGVVMLLLFWVGSFWREDPLASAPPPVWPRATLSVRPLAAALASALALLVLPQLAQAGLETLRDTRPVQLARVSASAGWQEATPGSATGGWASWRPTVHGAAAQAHQVFEKDGRRVGVFIAVYRDQRQDRELVNSLNQMVPPADHQWRVLGQQRLSRSAPPGEVRVVRMTSADGPQLAWQWYWLGQLSTASDTLAKLDLARERALGRSDTSAWVVVHTPDAGEGRAVIEQFLAEMGPALDAALSETAQR